MFVFGSKHKHSDHRNRSRTQSTVEIAVDLFVTLSKEGQKRGGRIDAGG